MSKKILSILLILGMVVLNIPGDISADPPGAPIQEEGHAEIPPNNPSYDPPDLMGGDGFDIDGDGYPDLPQEHCTGGDLDGNGVFDWQQTDENNNGIFDHLEEDPGTYKDIDGDMIPDLAFLTYEKEDGGMIGLVKYLTDVGKESWEEDLRRREEEYLQRRREEEEEMRRRNEEAERREREEAQNRIEEEDEMDGEDIAMMQELLEEASEHGAEGDIDFIIDHLEDKEEEVAKTAANALGSAANNGIPHELIEKIVTELAVVIFDEEDHQNRAESVNSLAVVLEQDIDEEVEYIAIKAIEHALTTYPHPCIVDAASYALLETGDFESFLDSSKILMEQLKIEDYLATVGYSQKDTVEAVEKLRDQLEEMLEGMSDTESMTEEYRKKVEKFIKGHKNDLDRLLEQIKTQLEQLQPQK